MKNYGDRGGCYPPRPTASTDNTLLDLHNSSKDTQPHSLIVNEKDGSVDLYTPSNSVHDPIRVILLKP